MVRKNNLNIWLELTCIIRYIPIHMNYIDHDETFDQW